MMTINDYQKKAHEFADYVTPYTLDDANKKAICCEYIYPALGLTEEAGEVTGKFAKAVRDNNGEISDERREAIIKELGDVCWFVAELSTLLDVDLETVMINNIEKLTSRKERNKIHGDGDNR